MKRLFVGTLLFFSTLLGSIHAAALGNGIKIGEITATSAIVWTRVTETAEYNKTGVPFKDDDEAIPVGLSLSEMRYSLTGTAGDVRIVYWPRGRIGDKVWMPWMPVDSNRDHTVQVQLHGLAPATHYTVEVHLRSADLPGPVVGYQGEFHTAPTEADAADVSFTVVTCHDFIRRDDLANGHLIYPAMAELKPQFMVHAGDVEYYDKPQPWAKNAELARYKWNRIFALPFQKDFYGSTGVYFQKDDHDILKNDAWPGDTYGDLTWDEGLGIFKEQTPTGARPYRTVRWGKHVQLWLLEGREYRSPNDIPDGPNKTILGAEQKAWFYETFAASDATFRIVMSPNPILGPDRPNKNDNHANEGFQHESQELRDFLAGQEDAFVICGDRHWQYATVDPVHGLREFGSGAGSDKHAGGWSMDRRTPEQKFLRIKGGFLHVVVEDNNGAPQARVQHRSVAGKLMNEEVLVAHSSPASRRQSEGSGWQDMFSGKASQLADFHIYNEGDVTPERWTVMGDVLTLASRKESPGLRAKEDLVITTEPVGDFELELDWKAGEGANGGVFYKSLEGGKYEKPWHTGLEYQLLDNAGHEEGAIDTHRAGDLYDLVAASEEVSRPALAWNHTRIVVRGSRIEHWLNGHLIIAEDTGAAEWDELVADSKYAMLEEFARPIPGHIILQDHGDRMWFKNIRIRKL
ncbi:MAG: hypothetical protein SynsKO_45660 [Synoicihabitans sp.]